jgi:hypothetical protein
MSNPYNPTADELTPQEGDKEEVLLLKIAAMLYGVVYGSYELEVTE